MAKEFKTIDELISLLESRNVETDNFTKTQLMRESYYAIVNGYKDPFIDKNAMQNSSDDIYVKGTRFEWIYNLFFVRSRLKGCYFSLSNKSRINNEKCCRLLILRKIPKS